jgi:hypothetical protein
VDEVVKLENNKTRENGPRKRKPEMAEQQASGLSAIFNPENAQKLAAWYIDTNERLAKEALTLQEQATSWAKETPFNAIFEAQRSLATQVIEGSASFARSLFRLEAPASK